MHLTVIIAVAIAVIAAVIYLRHHKTAEAKVEADASALKNAVVSEAEKIDAAVQAALKKPLQIVVAEAQKLEADAKKAL